MVRGMFGLSKPIFIPPKTTQITRTVSIFSDVPFFNFLVMSPFLILSPFLFDVRDLWSLIDSRTADVYRNVVVALRADRPLLADA